MAVTVETLDKLERKMTLSLPTTVIQSEVEMRLRHLGRSVKMDGFRPGKVPLNLLAQRYGDSVQTEVLGTKVGEAFTEAANQANLRIAGQPRFTEKDGAPAGQMMFDALFEVFPEIRIADLADTEIERLFCVVDEAAIDKTLQILRQQRRSFVPRPLEAAAQDGDNVTVDFEGKIDGEPFDGGKSEDFRFVIGEGRMLKEFEEAVRGMKSGESKTFPLVFPAEYPGKEMAGKTADFLVTVKKVEAGHLPELDEALIRSLGIADGSIDGLRADIRTSVEREVRSRLREHNKLAVMNALIAKAELDLPKTSVQVEVDRLLAAVRADLGQRGIKGADMVEIPTEKIRLQAERRVRLGLIMGELARTNRLQATPEQVNAHVVELSASYERPAEMARWYVEDHQRMAKAAALVTEDNVIEFVLTRAKVLEKVIPFDDLMPPSRD